MDTEWICFDAAKGYQEGELEHAAHDPADPAAHGHAVALGAGVREHALVVHGHPDGGLVRLVARRLARLEQHVVTGHELFVPRGEDRIALAETGQVARGLISVCAAGGQGGVAILEARP